MKKDAGLRVGSTTLMDEWKANRIELLVCGAESILALVRVSKWDKAVIDAAGSRLGRHTALGARCCWLT